MYKFIIRIEQCRLHIANTYDTFCYLRSLYVNLNYVAHMKIHLQIHIFKCIFIYLFIEYIKNTFEMKPHNSRILRNSLHIQRS